MTEFEPIRASLHELFRCVLADLDIRRALDDVRAQVDGFLSSSEYAGPSSPRVIAFGKAAVPMMEWLFNTYDFQDVEGVLSAPGGSKRSWQGIQCFAGGHPIPNSDSLRAAAAALAITDGASEQTPVIFLISGGGSALLECPIRSTMALEDVQSLNRILVSCGADIVDMNVVRKHLSAVKGGRLAASAFPARQLTLYVSDVPEGQDSSVASGPTMPDDSTLDDFREIVERYHLGRGLPGHVEALLDDPALPETPKPGEACFDRSQWVCILENRHAIESARRFASARGWSSEVDTSVDDTDVGAAAIHLLERLRRLRAAESGRPVCVISGGELSSPVRGRGIGGRNQAFVLECVERIEADAIAVLSVGTDGVDGNSPAAGAVADGSTMDRARQLGLDPKTFRDDSDAYTFFQQLGDDITCGPTQNNVRDLRILVAW